MVIHFCVVLFLTTIWGPFKKAFVPAVKVRQLSNKSVSWIRRRDAHILTVDRFTFIADERFQAFLVEATDTWTLQVKYVQARDAGVYECQVGTEPKMSHFVQLNVVVPKIEIVGESDMYVKAGTTVSLKCVITQALEEPAYIFWYHNDERVLNYDKSLVEIRMERVAPDTTVGNLIIYSPRREDSGNYSCSPSNLDSASVVLHVLSGKNIYINNNMFIAFHELDGASDGNIRWIRIFLLPQHPGTQAFQCSFWGRPWAPNLGANSRRRCSTATAAGRARRHPPACCCSPRSCSSRWVRPARPEGGTSEYTPPTPTAAGRARRHPESKRHTHTKHAYVEIHIASYPVIQDIDIQLKSMRCRHLNASDAGPMGVEILRRGLSRGLRQAARRRRSNSARAAPCDIHCATLGTKLYITLRETNYVHRRRRRRRPPSLYSCTYYG
ncbi:unnamed protein product [Chilo suppressalis]|uniref:Ig-like domain-containing protein n=1 Tax=Chilo suppressalis TaxID=168631 RepID=A0ABN8B2F9_CHISP|nr:unnamed protein product [Chilo suppressalis]